MDWLQLSESDYALFKSCDESESIVLINGSWVKMPKATICALTMDAYMRAFKGALKKLGVNDDLQFNRRESGKGWTLACPPGVVATSLEFELDIENGRARTSITHEDGRKSTASAPLRRLQLVPAAASDHGMLH